VKIIVQSDGEPPRGGMRAGRGQAHVRVKPEGQLYAIHRTLDGGHADLAVALRCVTIADREQRSRNRDGKEERTAGYQLLAVEVSTPDARRPRGVQPGL